jgi:hypothetical protein
MSGADERLSKKWQKLDEKRKRPFHFKPKAEPFAFADVFYV